MRKFLFLFLFTNAIYSQCWRTVEAKHSYHCIGIQTDGTLWTWGFNGSGQLGDNTLINKEEPIQIGAATNWKSVSSSFNNSFAIKTTGTLWAWGKNDEGQLGIGNTVSKTVPTQIGIQSTWATISAGYNYTLAIKTNGTLWAWGSNSGGRLGNGTVIDQLQPVQIGTANNWAKVEAGSVNSFAIKLDGTLWSWGGSLNGSDSSNTNFPAQVGTSTWTDISSNYLHVIGLKTNGTIWAWGSNASGELGRGNNLNIANNYIATQIGIATNWKAIVAGENHSMALKTNGTLWSWGENDYGQYGNNTTGVSFVPLQIGNLTNWKSISSGYSFSIGSKTNNDRVWTWGRDNQDALGNGVDGNSSIPVGLGTCTTLLNIDFIELANYFKIYPNPVNDYLNIENLSNLEIQEMKIIDVLGKIVLRQNTGFNKIDLQNLENGIYILSILTNENQTFQSKIIKN